METKQQELFKQASNNTLDAVVKFWGKGEYSEWKKSVKNLPKELSNTNNSKTFSKKQAKTQQNHLKNINRFPSFVIDAIYHIFINHKQLKNKKMIDKINKTMRMYRNHLINKQIKTLPMEQLNYILCQKWNDNVTDSMNMKPPSLSIHALIHRFHESNVYFCIDFDDSLFPTSKFEDLEEQNMLKWLKNCGFNEYFNNFQEEELNSVQDINDNIINDDDLKDIGIVNKSHRQKLLNEILEIDVDENGIVDGNQFQFEYKELNTEIIMDGLSKFFIQISDKYCYPNICIITNGSWSWIEYILNRYREYDELFKRFGIKYYSAYSMYSNAYKSYTRQWKIECFKFVTKRNGNGRIGSNKIEVYSIGDGLDEFVASNEFAKQMGNVSLCRIKLIDFPTEENIEQQFGTELFQLFQLFDERLMNDFVFNLDKILPSKYNEIDLYDDKNWSLSFPPTLKRNYIRLINATKSKLRNGIKLKYKDEIYDILNSSNWPKLELSQNTVIANIMDNEYKNMFQILLIDEQISNWMDEMNSFCKLCPKSKYNEKTNKWKIQKFASLEKLDGHYINIHNELPYIINKNENKSKDNTK